MKRYSTLLRTLCLVICFIPFFSELQAQTLNEGNIDESSIPSTIVYGNSVTFVATGQGAFPGTSPFSFTVNKGTITNNDGNSFTYTADWGYGPDTLYCYKSKNNTYDTAVISVVKQVEGIYNVMENGSYCAGDPGSEVWLDSSTATVDYELYQDGGATGNVVTGDGDSISFGLQPAGDYTVYNVDSAEWMNGTVTISEISAVTPDFIYLSDSVYCEGSAPGTAFGLDTSEIGVDYVLYNSVNDSITTYSGTGDSLNYGYFTDTTGYYTVTATNGGSCSQPLDDTLDFTIKNAPSIFSLSGPGGICPGVSSITVDLSDSETGIRYDLINQNTNSTHDSQFGTGSGISFAVTDTGSYYAVGIDTASGCSNLMNDTLVIDKYPEVNPSVAFTDTTICMGETVELFASGGDDYLWSPDSSLTNANTSSPEATPTSTTTYKATVIDASTGCSDSAFVNVTVAGLPTADAGADTSVCKGDSIQLSAGSVAGADYLWSPGASLSDTSAQKPYAFPTTNTKYTLTVTSNEGCENTDQVKVSVDTVPSPSVGDQTTCEGDSVTLTASGGDTYFWPATGATTQSIRVAPVTDETYIVEASYNNGCSSTDTAQVSVDPTPVISTIPSDTTVCEEQPVTISASATGGTGSYSYSWSPDGAGTSYSFDASSDVTYNIVVSDGNNCTDTATVPVSVNALPTVSISGLDAQYCSDEPGNTIFGSPSGANGDFRPDSLLSVDNGSGSAEFDPSILTPATSYDIIYEYTDGNGCIDTAMATTYISDDTIPDPSIINLDSAYCDDDASTYTISGVPTDSMGSFSALAGLTDNGDGTADLVPANVGIGTHNITYSYESEDGGCTSNVTESFRIGVPITMDFDTNYCATQDTFQLTVDKPAGTGSGIFYIFNATGDTIYSAQEGTSDAVFDPSTQLEGDYGVKYVVADTVLNCSNEDSVGIHVYPMPDAGFTLDGIPHDSINFRYCNNDSIVTLDGIINDGGTYNGAGIPGGSNKLDPSNTTPGNYTITYTYTSLSSGCSSTDSADVTIKPVPDVSINGLDPAYCNTDTTFEITASPDSGFYTVPSTWNDSTIFYDNSDGSADFNPSNVPSTGNFDITYTAVGSNGCSNDTTQQVTIEAPASVTINNLPASICKNAAPVTINGNPTDSNGVFKSPSFLIDSGNGMATFDPSLAPSAGIYDVIYKYTEPLSGCVAADTNTVIINPLPNTYSLLGGGAYCDGEPGLKLSMSNSDSSVRYRLYKNGSLFEDTLRTSDGAFDFEGRWQAGDYYVTARTTNGCVDTMNNTSTISVNYPPEDAYGISGDSIVAIGGSGSYTVPVLDSTETYNWSIPGGASISSGSGMRTIDVSFSAVSSGFDSVSVYGTNSTGCGDGAPAYYKIYILPYPDTAGPITGDTSICEADQYVYSIPSLSNADSIYWTMPTGFSIVSGSGTNSVNLQVDSAASSGYLTARGVNASGEGEPDSLYVQVNPIPSIGAVSVTDQLDCAVDSVLLIGSSSPGGTYTWTGGGQTINNDSAYATVSGDYTFKVKANGCSNDSTVTVTANYAAPTAVIDSPDVITCDNPTEQLEVTTNAGSPEYVWTAGGGGNIVSGDSTATPFVDAEGSYAVTVTNTVNSCTSTSSVNVSVDTTKPSFTIYEPQDITCARDTSVITADNVPNADYIWSGPSFIDGQGTSSLTVDEPGLYSLKVKKLNNGCSLTKQRTVPIDTVKPVNVNLTKSGDLNCIDNQITLTASSGTVGVSYDFTALDGSGIVSTSGNTALVDEAGDYMVSVIDNISGCITKDTVNVQDFTETVNVDIDVAFGNINCNHPEDTLEVVSDLTDRDVQWSTSDGHIVSGIFNSVAIVDSAGTYTVTVTDTVSGCSNTLSETITKDFSTPTIGPITQNPDSLTCTSDVNLVADVSGSSSLSWSGPGNIYPDPTQDSVYVDAHGTYTITAIKSNGCPSSKSTEVAADTNKPDMVLINNYDDITCSNPRDTLRVRSNTPNVTYQWTKVSGSGNIIDGASTQRPVVNGEGTYQIVITGDNGCTKQGQVTVDDDYREPVISNFDGEPDSISCSNDWVQLVGTSSTPNAEYFWSTLGTGSILYETTDTAMVNQTGTYNLTITHPVTGCTTDTSVEVESNFAAPDAIVADNPGQITCAVDTVRLDGSASTGTNLNWTARNGSNFIPNNKVERPYVTSDGWYILTVEHPSSGCTDKDSVKVEAAQDVPYILMGYHEDTLTCNRTQIKIPVDSVDVPDYWWTTPDGNIVSGDSTLEATVDAPGTYKFHAVDSATGCTNSKSVVIDEYTQKPNVSLSADTLSCIVDTIHIDSRVEFATDPTKVTYNWSAGAGGNIIPGDENLPNPRVTASANYELTLTDDINGCTRSVTHFVERSNNKPVINIDKDPKDITCARSKVTLEDNTGQTKVSYEWSTTGSGNIANKYTPTPTVDAAGWYTLRITNNSNGCYIEDSVQVDTNYTTPSVYIDPVNDITCSNPEVQLSGGSSDSVSYQWTGGNITGDPTSPLTYADEGGQYTLTVTDKVNGCPNDSTITVVENNTPPSVPQVDDESSCYGSPNVTLTATGTNIKWYSGPGLTASDLITTGTSYTPTFSSPGDSVYYVTQTGTNGCESAASTAIYTIHTLPAKPVAADTAICYGSPNPFLEAYPSNSNYDINWYNNTDSLLSTSTSYKPKDSTVGVHEYGVTQVDLNGCESAQEDVYFTINDLPAAPVVDEDTLKVCYGSNSKTFVANGTNIKWYNTEPPANPVETGNIFTPSEVTTGTYTYYVTQSSGTTTCESNFTQVTYIILPNPQKYDLLGGGTYCEGTGGAEIYLNNSENTATYELQRDGNTFITGIAGDGDSISFGNITAEGTYTAYATADNGCISKMDSTAVISQNPLPADAGTIVGDSAVCQGSKSIVYSVPEIQYATDYIWSVPTGASIVAGSNSSEITVNYSDNAQDGIVSVYGSNACGNGGSATGHAITVNSLPDSAGTITGPAQVCQGAQGVAFEVPQIANATTYDWQLPTGANIASGDGTRQILVNFTESASGGIVKVRGGNACGYGTFSADHTINVADKPQIVTDQYKSVCSSSDSLIVENPGGGVTVTWTLIAGQGTIANSADFATEVTNLGSGINKFEVALTNGTCAAADTVTIENNQLFVDAGTNESLCTDSTYLSASIPDPGVTGTWSATQGSGSFADANAYNTKVTDIGGGENVFRWTLSKNGCKSYDEVTITNNAPTNAEAGISRDVCVDSLDLNANPTGANETGTWSLVGGYVNFTNENDPQTSITDIAKGENVLKWTIEKGNCSSSDQVTITNNQVEVEAGDNQVICTYTTTLNATPPPSGTSAHWEVARGSADIIDPTAPTTDLYLLVEDTTVLEWVVEKNGCYSKDSVVIINDSPTKADAGNDQIIFQSSTFLDALDPEKGTGEWALLSGAGDFADANDPNTEVTNLAHGINKFQWLVTFNSCTSIDTVVVDNQTTGGVDAGPDTTICKDQIELSASEPIQGEGEWSVVTGAANFNNSSDPNTIARGLAKGTNKLRWTVVGNGIVTDEVVIINDSPTTANAGPDMTYCADSTQLSANVPTVGDGVWSIIGGSGTFEDTTLNNTKVSNLGTGNNTLRWTITHNSCKSSDDVVITNDKPTVADAGQDQTLCSDEAVLYGNSPSVGQGLWTLVSGSNSVIFQNQTIGNTIVNNLGHGENILRWTITNNNCSSSDEVVITNDNPTEANAGRDKAICVDSFRLNANEAVIGESSWKVINGYGEFGDTAQHNTMVRNLDKGNNLLRWTITHNGCVSYDEVEIANNLVDADAGFSQDICVDSTSLSANNPAPGTGYWSVVAGSASFDDPNQSDTDVSGLDYQVPNILKWTIANEGCVSSDTITITNNHPGIIYAGQDKEVCGSNVMLKANPNYLGEGEWEPLVGGGNIADPDSSTTSVSDLGLGNNTFRWTIQRNGCIYSDEVAVYNNSPVEAYAGESDSTCSSSYTLYAEEPPFGRGRWTVVYGSGEFENDTAYTTTVKNMAQGANTYRWTLYNGSCSTSDEVTIYVNKPDIPLAGPDKSICADSTTLQGNDPGADQTGYWEIVEGSAVFGDQNDPKTKVTGLNYGRNVLRWNIEKNGCLLYDEVTITNNSPTVAFAGDNMHVCGDETNLNAEQPSIGTGEWSLVSGTATFEDKMAPNTLVTDLSYGPNTLRWTTSYNGCTSFDDVIIYNDKATAYAGEDQVTYEPSAYLVGNTPTLGDGSWIILGGSGTFENPDSAQTKVMDLAPGVNTFRWKITNNSCIAFDEVSITYYEMPKVEFTVDKDRGCPPLTVQFLNKSLNTNSQFEWNFGDNNISTHENPRHTYYDPGEYTVELSTTGPDGSLVTEDTVIIVHNEPEARFEVAPKTLYIPEQHLQCYNMSIDAKEFLWHFGDDSTSTLQNPRHMYQDTGAYSIGLEVWSKYNCYDSIVRPNLVEVIQSGQIKFPSGFTPNPSGPVGGRYDENDRNNDVFYPIVKGVKEYHLEIFNRWGVMVFQSENVEIGWDGYFKGKLAPEGVYIYKVYGRYNNGRAFEKAGDFILIRK